MDRHQIRERMSEEMDAFRDELVKLLEDSSPEQFKAVDLLTAIAICEG